MKAIKRIKSWINHNISFLSLLNSPFKPLKLVWYFGEISHGTPYFLPRKWVKFTLADAKDAVDKETAKLEGRGHIIKRTYEERVKSFMRHSKPVQVKYLWFDFVPMGWKTKWDDYRFEWNPAISIVIFGKQLHIAIVPNINPRCWQDIYWEAWLNYSRRTDRKLSKEERLKELFKIHSCTWRSSEGATDYYPYILKEKYLKNYGQK